MRVLCATPRSGSTAVAEWLSIPNQVKSYSEFCNPGYMQGLHGSEWGARRDEYFNDPSMGLKIMMEHFKVDYVPYMQENGAYLMIRLDKKAQAVSYYIATETNHWYKSDARGQRIPRFDYDLIEVHMQRIILQEIAWMDIFLKYDIQWKPLIYEDLLCKGVLTRSDADQYGLVEKQRYHYQFHNALWNRMSSNWVNRLTNSKWKGEKIV